ncbi:MAG: ferrous iron transporter B [Clostridia bacterium]|nr:ferrous iron transporter B [Clostridia bacterium]
MRIALAGNPNSGKTTMYNALTGSNEKVGNWAGVTVDIKAHPIKKKFYEGEGELVAVDLPGAYSMSPFTSEESITRDYVKTANPDVIINIVDATNISRSLFFTTQLLELGIPVVLALNKSDINEKKQTIIDTEALSKKLCCKIVNTVSVDGEGLSELIATAVSMVGQGQTAPYSGAGVDMTNKEAVKASDRNRFEFVKGIVASVESRKVLTRDRSVDDKIDEILTNKWLGIPIFGLVMFLVFGVSQAWVGPFIADTLVGLIEMFQEWVGGLLENAHPLLSALLVDGIIGGVGAVIGFLPLVMVMYFLIAMLEECGYMSRVAVVLDPIFKKVGLSGKSVIPFVITVGCAIPGVMASRTIRNERERRATAMLSPFMPCGAKLPVISLFAGVFFDNSWIVSALMYFAGIALIFIGAFVVNKIAGYKAKKSFFIIELPEYKAPSFKHAWNSMISRGWAYIVKAGTIILVCNTAVQIMQSFNWSFQLIEEGMEHTSILASIATPFAFLLIPLGFGVWQMAAAAITGFIAKENVVGTIAVCYGITNFINVDELVLESGADEVAAIFGITKVAALACLMFNLFTPPCFAAIGAMNSEIKDRKWFFGGIGLQFATGYTVAFLVYQLGTLFTTGGFGDGFIWGLIAVAAMVGVIVYLALRAKAQDKVEYTLE